VYYNSNQNSNEYYSSYKQELSSLQPKYRETSSLSTPIKIGLGIILLSLIGLGASYLSKYFSTSDIEVATEINKENNISDTKEEEIPKIIIIEDKLPKSIQIINSEKRIISNIKNNATDSLANDLSSTNKEENEIKKQVISLRETSNMTAEDIANIVNIILHKKREEKKLSLEEELLNAEKPDSKTYRLEETNHYNKVVLSKRDKSSEEKLEKLNQNLEQSNQSIQLSAYEASLKSEIATRSNAMRIIVVKKGDSLSKLAEKAYGDRLAYKKILKANPEIIKNPNQIFVGQKIRIPL
jgi:hypothetical protein